MTCAVNVTLGIHTVYGTHLAHSRLTRKSEGHGQGHMVIGCAAGMSMRIDRTA